MVLGDHKDERAFALLGQLLTDQLEPYSPASDEEKAMNMVLLAEKRAREQYGNPVAWKRFVHPGLVQTWDEIEVYRHEYTWCLRHRQTIANILGAWNDPRAIPMLLQALQKCWEVEQQTRHGSLQTLHHLEDKLAYTLGQLEAWHALEGLDTAVLPPSRFKLARMFLVFGSLRVNLQHLYRGNITALITLGTIDADQVTRVCENDLVWMNISPEPISTCFSNGIRNVMNSGNGGDVLRVVKLKGFRGSLTFQGLNGPTP